MEKDIGFDMSEAAAKIVAAETDSEFGCPSTKFPADASVTMAYIPYQLDRNAYTPEQALMYGTLFVTLNKPFLGWERKR